MEKETVIEPDCECCVTPGEPEELSYTCADRKYVFTKNEQEILGKIRENALQARDVKERIRRLSVDSDGEVLRESEVELERLRRIRGELEVERLAAAEERMHILGHL
jgi:hypothetical protein